MKIDWVTKTITLSEQETYYERSLDPVIYQRVAAAIKDADNVVDYEGNYIKRKFGSCTMTAKRTMPMPSGSDFKIRRVSNYELAQEHKAKADQIADDLESGNLSHRTEILLHSERRYQMQLAQYHLTLALAGA